MAVGTQPDPVFSTGCYSTR